MSRRGAFAGALIFLAACDRFPPPPEERAATKTGAPVGEARPSGPPPLVELEVRGRVTAPAIAHGTIVVVATDGPCFELGSHYLASAEAERDGRYQLHFFPQRDSHVELCAALLAGERRATQLHGRAPGNLPTNERHTLDGIDVQLTRGNTITLPNLKR